MLPSNSNTDAPAAATSVDSRQALPDDAGDRATVADTNASRAASDAPAAPAMPAARERRLPLHADHDEPPPRFARGRPLDMPVIAGWTPRSEAIDGEVAEALEEMMQN